MAIETPTQLTIPFVNFKQRYALLRNEILDTVDQIFSSGQYILGDVVQEFEQEICKLLGCQYAIAVANGTDALILALKVLEIGIGDEVIIPVNSFVASVGAVVAVGATPVFCDVSDDLNIDVEKIIPLITPHTKAIMPVHLTGRPADMDAISAIAQKFSLVILEDAAQSIGAKFDNKYTGTLGAMGCFSLHPLKNLFVLGDGGFITTDNEKYANKLKLMRHHGLVDRDNCLAWGLNSRLDSVQAGIGLVGLRHLKHWTNQRRKFATIYQNSLKHVVKIPVDQGKYFSVYHNFVVLCDRRDELMQYLLENGIETKIHYPIPLHKQVAAKNLACLKNDFSNAEQLAKSMLSLPVYPELTENDIKNICDCILSFYEEKNA